MSWFGLKVPNAAKDTAAGEQLPRARRQAPMSTPKPYFPTGGWMRRSWPR